MGMVVALGKEAMLTSALCSAGLVALASPFSSGGRRTPISKRPQGCQGLPRRLLIVTPRQTSFLGWLAQCVCVGWEVGRNCNLALGREGRAPHLRWARQPLRNPAAAFSPPVERDPSPPGCTALTRGQGGQDRKGTRK